jgi:hypothetical protein
VVVHLCSRGRCGCWRGVQLRRGHHLWCVRAERCLESCRCGACSQSITNAVYCFSHTREAAPNLPVYVVELFDDLVALDAQLLLLVGCSSCRLLRMS